MGSASSTSPCSVIFADHADRALVLDVVVDKLGGHHVLDGLVFEHADLRLLDRQASQVLRLLQAGNHHRFHNAIDFLLRALGERGCRPLRLSYQAIQIGNSFFTQTSAVVTHTSFFVRQKLPKFIQFQYGRAVNGGQ